MFKKKEGQMNVPTKGLNKDSWSGAEADYSHLQNGNFDNFDGGTFILTNEMSNILASKFKTGFRVIHVKNDIDTEDTYFFLVNPPSKFLDPKSRILFNTFTCLEFNSLSLCLSQNLVFSLIY